MLLRVAEARFAGLPAEGPSPGAVSDWNPWTSAITLEHTSAAPAALRFLSWRP